MTKRLYALSCLRRRGVTAQRAYDFTVAMINHVAASETWSAERRAAALADLKADMATAFGATTAERLTLSR